MQASQPREPLLQDKPATRPGEAIAADFFSQDGKEFLVITDKYSGWPDLWDCGRGVSTKTTIACISAWCSRMGVPNRMTTDNGPQFKSQEFADFCKDWGIKHEPSSPYHHIANGHAEAAVKSMKSLIKKTKRDQHFIENLAKAVLEYRNTPRKDGLSPAQRLFGRPMRTRLPSHPLIFKADIQRKLQDADKKASGLREKAKARYDHGTKEMDKLEVGDIVRVQHASTSKWDLIGQIIERHDRDRSYRVKTESGKIYWRNRRFLKLCKEDIEPTSAEDSAKTVRRSKRVRRAPERFQSHK